MVTCHLRKALKCKPGLATQSRREGYSREGNSISEVKEVEEHGSVGSSTWLKQKVQKRKLKLGRRVGSE